MATMNIVDGETKIFCNQEICGRHMKLRFSIVSCGKSYKVQEATIIRFLVFEFAFQFLRCVDDESAMKVVIQTKTRPVKDYILKFDLICQKPPIEKKITCPDSEGWSNWIPILKMEPYAVYGNVQFYLIDLSLFVYKVAKTQCDLLYNDEDFTDYNLSTENGSIVPVHRACMAAHSDVFKTMLNGEWRETAKGCLEIKGLDVTLDTLKHLKDYMYLRTLPEDGLRPLLLIADCYMIHDLRSQCIRKLALTVTADQLLDLLEFATMNKIADLTIAILIMTPKSVVQAVDENRIRERNKQIVNAATQ